MPDNKRIFATSVALICVSVILTMDVIGAYAETLNGTERSIVSPDKQWEYRCRDGVWSSIVKTDTHEMVVDLSNEVEVPYCRDANVVWAPGSKHFALNYSPPHASHATYETIAFYQLRDDKWVALRSPVDETSNRAQLVQLVKKYPPKKAYQRRVWNASPIRDVLKVRKWTDPDTAILYAYSAWSGPRSNETEAAFLFTLKFDRDGKWKSVKTQQLSAKEAEKENVGER